MNSPRLIWEKIIPYNHQPISLLENIKNDMFYINMDCGCCQYPMVTGMLTWGRMLHVSSAYGLPYFKGLIFHNRPVVDPIFPAKGADFVGLPTLNAAMFQKTICQNERNWPLGGVLWRPLWIRQCCPPPSSHCMSKSLLTISESGPNPTAKIYC